MASLKRTPQMIEGKEAEDVKKDKRCQQLEQVNGCCHDGLMEVVQVTDG